MSEVQVLESRGAARVKMGMRPTVRKRFRSGS